MLNQRLSNSRLLPALVFSAALSFSMTASAQSSGNLGELFATEATPNGPLMQAGTGMPVASGSELSAGRATATLRLERGGEIKICPQSRISVTGNPGHAPLMMALGVSSAEISYPMDDLTDLLLTPDFKLSLAGPGTFHFAVGVNSRGDTCIRPLRGNSAGIVISELMGSGTYTLKPDESAMFGGGRLSARAPLVSACGCPVLPASLRAEAKPAPGQAPPTPQKAPETVHMSVEAPLVFRGDQQAQPSYSVAKIRYSALPNVFLLQEKVEPVAPPAATKSKEHKGFFGSIRGFFSSIFKH